jgi:hypothetical protein
MWGQPPRLSAERSDAHVWNGHSCLLPLILISTPLLTLSFATDTYSSQTRKSTTFNRAANSPRKEPASAAEGPLCPLASRRHRQELLNPNRKLDKMHRTVRSNTPRRK